jgi:hypothetical protein
MTALVARVRLMVGDTAAAPVFTDDQVQEALDAHRADVVRMELESVPTVQPGGAILVPASYVDHYAVDGVGDWEDDLRFYDLTYNPITPDDRGEPGRPLDLRRRPAPAGLPDRQGLRLRPRRRGPARPVGRPVHAVVRLRVGQPALPPQPDGQDAARPGQGVPLPRPPALVPLVRDDVDPRSA